jgi:hypothetical protein
MWNVEARQNNTNPVFMYDFPGKCLIYPLVFNIMAKLLLVSSSVSDMDSYGKKCKNFYQKAAIYLSLGLHIEGPSYRRSLQPP